STLPARCLQAASKRSTSSGEGIHPEASTGSGSVTVMTVTLAFKAFAKAIPCLTPFLARSDPSVLKRILAYIRGLPCSSNIFPTKVILTYMVRSSPSVYGPAAHSHKTGWDSVGAASVTALLKLNRSFAKLGQCGKPAIVAFKIRQLAP